MRQSQIHCWTLINLSQHSVSICASWRFHILWTKNLLGSPTRILDFFFQRLNSNLLSIKWWKVRIITINGHQVELWGTARPHSPVPETTPGHWLLLLYLAQAVSDYICLRALWYGNSCAQKNPDPRYCPQFIQSLLSPGRGTQTIKICSRAEFLQQVKESIDPLTAAKHFTESGPSEDGNGSPRNSTGAAGACRCTVRKKQCSVAQHTEQAAGTAGWFWTQLQGQQGQLLLNTLHLPFSKRGSHKKFTLCSGHNVFKWTTHTFFRNN